MIVITVVVTCLVGVAGLEGCVGSGCLVDGGVVCGLLVGGVVRGVVDGTISGVGGCGVLGSRLVVGAAVVDGWSTARSLVYTVLGGAVVTSTEGAGPVVSDLRGAVVRGVDRTTEVSVTCGTSSFAGSGVGSIAFAWMRVATFRCPFLLEAESESSSIVRNPPRLSVLGAVATDALEWDLLPKVLRDGVTSSWKEESSKDSPCNAAVSSCFCLSTENMEAAKFAPPPTMTAVLAAATSFKPMLLPMRAVEAVLEVIRAAT